MEELSLKIESLEGNELTIRQGEAAPIIEPLKQTATGDIRTVGTFIRGRNTVSNLQAVTPSTTIVTVNKEAGTINLSGNPNDQFASDVSGRLEGSDELKVFRINETKTFSQKELIKLLKFNRIYFVDVLIHQELLTKYTAFTFSTETSGHASVDDRGNKSNAIAKSVATNIPKEFSLYLPIYKGERHIRFRVEICMDVTDGGAAFWLESVELHELQQTEKEVIFERELEACKGLVVIFK